MVKFPESRPSQFWKIKQGKWDAISNPCRIAISLSWPEIQCLLPYTRYQVMDKEHVTMTTKAGGYAQVCKTWVGRTVLIFISTFLIGCVGGSPAKSLKPDRLQSSHVLDDSSVCSRPDDEAELLVVDLPANRRADLEVIMSEGLAAVQYDCKTLKLLKSCRIDGGYAV